MGKQVVFIKNFWEEKKLVVDTKGVKYNELY